jgi:hypothetical protein
MDFNEITNLSKQQNLVELVESINSPELVTEDIALDLLVTREKVLRKMTGLRTDEDIQYFQDMFIDWLFDDDEGDVMRVNHYADIHDAFDAMMKEHGVKSSHGKAHPMDFYNNFFKIKLPSVKKKKK